MRSTINLESDKDKQLYRVAFHEASHVVMALAYSKIFQLDKPVYEGVYIAWNEAEKQTYGALEPDKGYRLDQIIMNCIDGRSKGALEKALVELGSFLAGPASDQLLETELGNYDENLTKYTDKQYNFELDKGYTGDLIQSTLLCHVIWDKSEIQIGQPLHKETYHCIHLVQKDIHRCRDLIEQITVELFRKKRLSKTALEEHCNSIWSEIPDELALPKILNEI